MGAGEMDQRLRALETSSIPSTHMEAENRLNSSSRGIRHPLLTSAALHDMCAQTYMQTVYPYT